MFVVLFDAFSVVVLVIVAVAVVVAVSAPTTFTFTFAFAGERLLAPLIVALGLTFFVLLSFVELFVFASVGDFFDAFLTGTVLGDDFFFVAAESSNKSSLSESSTIFLLFFLVVISNLIPKQSKLMMNFLLFLEMLPFFLF